MDGGSYGAPSAAVRMHAHPLVSPLSCSAPPIPPHLHAQADAQVRRVVCARILCRQDLALHAAPAKPAWHQHAVSAAQLHPGIWSTGGEAGGAQCWKSAFPQVQGGEAAQRTTARQQQPRRRRRRPQRWPPPTHPPTVVRRLIFRLGGLLKVAGLHPINLHTPGGRHVGRTLGLNDSAEHAGTLAAAPQHAATLRPHSFHHCSLHPPPSPTLILPTHPPPSPTLSLRFAAMHACCSAFVTDR